MRKTEKIANRIILSVVICIILVMLICSKSTSFLPMAFGWHDEYNLATLKKIYDKNLFQKDRFIIGYGWLANKIGIKEINNLVKYESIAYFKDKNIVDIDKKVNAICALNNELNGKFAYVLLPSPIMSDYDRFHRYFYTDTYNGVHKFLNELRSRNIAVFDLSKYNNHKPLDYRYFVSDHHWRPEFAFEFMKPIVEVFKSFYQDTNVDPYYFDINNYNIETHEHLALGSYGKRVGHKFLMPDDFSIIMPKYDTNFDVKSYFFKNDEVHHGDYNKMFVSRNYLSKDYMNTLTYKVYAGDIAKRMHVHNNTPLIKKKIAILLDSYAYPISTFLCNIFEDVYTIDIRYQKDDALKFIKDANPDLVLALYSQFALDYNELFEVR